MHTLHDAYAARLVAADQARRNRELKERVDSLRPAHKPVPRRLYHRVCVLCCSAATLLFVALVYSVLRLVWGAAV